VAAAEGAVAAIHIHKFLIPDTHKLQATRVNIVAIDALNDFRMTDENYHKAKPQSGSFAAKLKLIREMQVGFGG